MRLSRDRGVDNVPGGGRYGYAVGRPGPVPRRNRKAGGQVGAARPARKLTRRAVLASGLAAVSVVSDYPDWSGHVAQAAQIAATGAPPLTLSNGVSNHVVDVAASGSQAAASFTFQQPAYEIFINAFSISGGTPGPLRIRLQWYEDNGASLMDVKYYYIWPGVTSLGNMVFGKGPSRAGLLSLIFDNLGTGGTGMGYEVHYWIFQRSHFYLQDDWRSLSFANSESSTPIATNELPSGLVGTATATVAAGATATTLLPLYQGQAQLYADTSSATTDMQVTIQDAANPNSAGIGTRIWRARSDANGLLTASVELPGYQCQVELKNLNAASKTLYYALHTSPV